MTSASFRQLDAQKEKLNERFDLVLCNQVIEHLVDDMAALRNMALMAKRWVLVRAMRGRMRKSELAIGHFRNYSDVELHAKARVPGWKTLTSSGGDFRFIPLSTVR